MEGHLHLKLPIRCLIFIGCWPLEFKNKFLSFLYKIHSKFTWTFYILVIISELIELYAALMDRNLEKISFLWGIFCFHFLGVQKLLVFNGKTMQKLKTKVFVTERNILDSKDDQTKEIYMRYVKKNHFGNSIMINTAISCVFLFNCIPYITDVLNPLDSLYEIIDNKTIVYKPRPLPISTWVPFDRYKFYYVTYTFHVMVLIFYPTCVVGLNTFFYGLIVFVMGQIKILQQSLMDFEKVKDISILKGLEKCILHHQDIIEYVMELSNALKTSLMFDFVGYSLQIAVLGFQVAVSNFSLDLVIPAMYLLSMLMQLFLFYWYANGVMLESINISKAIWNSMWYVCDKNTKQILSLIMIRAQKPLLISVGPFYYMSMETFVSILRVAYSYAMLMRRLYRK